MTALDLFSGVGMHAHGLRMAGVDLIGLCERDPFCRAVLEKNFPGVPIHDDIKTLDAKNIHADLISGGPPCQPSSVAGSRKGVADDRWLWPAFLRVVREARPLWVLAENPCGIITLKPHGLKWIVDELAASGYGVQCFVVGARHCGAPHRRDRVWIVGRLADGDGQRIANADELRREQWTRGAGTTDAGGDGADVANTHRDGWRARREKKRDEGCAGIGRRESAGGGELGDDNRPRQLQSGGGESNIVEKLGNTGSFRRKNGRRVFSEISGSTATENEVERNQAIRTIFTRWPARPGERQHEWESPRLLSVELGRPTPSDAPGLVRVADGETRRLVSRQNKEALKALGNGNPWIVPFLIARRMRGLHD